MIIRLQDKVGQLRTAKVGFSWTVFFFGFFVPICRGDAKWAIIMFVACVLSVGLANLVFCFTYNGTFVRGLLSQGFYPADDISKEILVRKGFLGAVNSFM